MSEVILSDANFDAEVVKSTVPVFVDFWAPWCGPCQVMGPVVEEMSTTYAASTIKIAKLNVDDNPETAGKYGVLSIPTFIVFKDGVPADTLVGGVSKEKLKSFVDKHVV